MTATAPATPETRNIELSVEIAAPKEAVWKAISDGEGLASWFSPIASVDPGEGGSVTVSWGAGSEWTSGITVWRPGEHLQLVDELPEEAVDQGAMMALDYHLAESDGTTRLHLVNSGLPAGEDGDEFFYMMDKGWRFFLWNLKHVVERHPGVARHMISARPWVTGTREEVWDRIFGEEGLGVVTDGPGSASLEASPSAGEPFRFRLDGGEALAGTVVLSDRPWAFAGVVASLNDGVLHVELEGRGDRWKLGVWLSAYGVERGRCEQMREALEKTITRIFPEHP